MTNAQFLSKIKGFELENWIKKAWKRLPASARKTLLAFWTDKLEFVMLPDFSAANKKHHRCKFIAAQTTGISFRFSKFMFDEINETAGISIIAHEFCHAYRAANGLEDGNITRFKKQRDGFDSEEALVDKTIAKWGFDVAAVNTFFAVFMIKHDPKTRRIFEKRVNEEVNKRLKGYVNRLDKEMKIIAAMA